MDKEVDVIKITETDIDELRLIIDPEKDVVVMIVPDNNGISE
jgi:hypothetical protein